LFVVTKLVMSESTPRAMNPPSKTNWAGKRSLSRPANRRKEANVSE
jgi:hypothetical protein